jgi:hypothetical protein
VRLCLSSVTSLDSRGDGHADVQIIFAVKIAKRLSRPPLSTSLA